MPTPIIYPLSRLSDSHPTLRALIAMGPGAGPIEIFRAATVGADSALTLAVSACAVWCVVLGGIYAFGGALAAADGRRAFKLFEASCARKHPEGCVLLARMYADGIGVVQDAGRAKQLLTEQCDGGAPGACTILAFTLWDGREYGAAVPLFRRACGEGDGRACNMVGFAHYTAKGARWDVARAVAVFV